MKFYLFIALSLFLSTAITAQSTSWKKLVNQGDELMEKGKFLEAARSFEMAFKMKPEKEKIASKAGAAFFRARNYKMALKMLRPIKKESNDYPLAAFWYAKSLKASGEFDKAIKSFKGFRSRYPGAKTDPVLSMAATEIEGCILAMELEGIPVSEAPKALPINSMANEFGIVPFSEDIIYYTTSEKGTTRMQRTQFSGGKWSEPVTPEFPGMPTGHFGQGAFNAEKTAFYFTICSNAKPWDSRDMICDIYAIKRVGNEWSEPEKLRDYLKGDGKTATHPFAYNDGKNEVLIYATDQSGGEGGLDLWKTTRPVGSEDFDFSYPEHMGSMINSEGDEITPFVNMENGKLYFSSNGFANLGGFDIFQVNVDKANMEEPENVGYPLNSNADDYYFRMAEGSAVQYFTSNRSTSDWETTTDDNVFQLGAAVDPIVSLTGTVKNRNTSENIENAMVMVIETMEDGREVLMTTQATNKGQFELPILSDKNYKLEASAEGHISNEVELSKADLMGSSMMQKDIYLMPNDVNILATTTVPSTTNTASKPTASPEKVLATNNVPDSVLPRRNPVVNTTPKNTTVAETTVPDVDPMVNRAPTAKAEDKVYTNPATINSGAEVVETYSSVSASKSYNATKNYNTTTANTSGLYTNSRFAGDGVQTTAPMHKGSYYKIQLSIVIDYNPNSNEYQSIMELGRLDTEYIISKGWTRVLLADYFSKEEALRVLNEARKRGFVEAFLVRYQDGYRKI